MDQRIGIDTELLNRFGDAVLTIQPTRDRIPTLWVDRSRTLEVLRYLKLEIDGPFLCLYDLCGIDERVRGNRDGQPDFSSADNKIKLAAANHYY